MGLTKKTGHIVLYIFFTKSKCIDVAFKRRGMCFVDSIRLLHVPNKVRTQRSSLEVAGYMLDCGYTSVLRIVAINKQKKRGGKVMHSVFNPFSMDSWMATNCIDKIANGGQGKDYRLRCTRLATTPQT